MKKAIYTMLLCVSAVLTGWAQQTVKVGSIEELRSQEKGTSVVLTMACDTVLSTLDGGLCLSDGYRIRIEGMDIEAMQIISGTLAGVVGERNGYPLLQVRAAGSHYQTLDKMSWTMFIDMDNYEKSLANAGNGTVNLGPDVPKDPRTGFTNVDGIKAFKELADGAEARLVLTYDTVLFARNGDIYVRDGNGGGAIIFKDTGLDLKEGMVLLGTVVGRLSIVEGKPLFTATENTTDKYYIMVNQTPYTMPFYDFDEGGQDSQIDDVVVTGEVMVDSMPDVAGVRRLYAYKQKGSSRVQLTDKYGFSKKAISVPAKCSNLKGILVSNTDRELYLLTDISAIAQPTGIRAIEEKRAAVDAPLYDLQGRRVDAEPQKGIYIQNGRKVVRTK